MEITSLTNDIQWKCCRMVQVGTLYWQNNQLRSRPITTQTLQTMLIGVDLNNAREKMFGENIQHFIFNRTTRNANQANSCVLSWPILFTWNYHCDVHYIYPRVFHLIWTCHVWIIAVIYTALTNCLYAFELINQVFPIRIRLKRFKCSEVETML